MYMTQEDDKPSGKSSGKKNTKRVSKRASKKTSDSDSDVDDVSEAYRNKIQKALQANLDDYIKNRNLNQKQIAAINSYVEEHLSCFVLLGYTVAGEPISVVNSQTQKDSDSLGTLLQKFLSKYSEPPGNITMY